MIPSSKANRAKALSIVNDKGRYHSFSIRASTTAQEQAQGQPDVSRKVLRTQTGRPLPWGE